MLILFVGPYLSGCSTLGKVWPFSGNQQKRQQLEPVKTEEKLQKEAIQYFRRGRFILAEELFQKIKDRYPFSPYAAIAELRLADCKFFQGLYEEAIPLYEEFEKLHPTHQYVPYAIFQIGTCYYRLMATPDRDQTFTHKVIETFERLLRRYPDSPYSFEAKRRIQVARERLAAHELVVAKWYIRTGQKKQALFRLKTLLERYPNTTIAGDAQQLQSQLLSSPEGKVAEIEDETSSIWKSLWPFN